jgi:hypothetical protein
MEKIHVEIIEGRPFKGAVEGLPFKGAFIIFSLMTIHYHPISDDL